MNPFCFLIKCSLVIAIDPSSPFSGGAVLGSKLQNRIPIPDLSIIRQVFEIIK